MSLQMWVNGLLCHCVVITVEQALTDQYTAYIFEKSLGYTWLEKLNIQNALVRTPVLGWDMPLFFSPSDMYKLY